MGVVAFSWPKRGLLDGWESGDLLTAGVSCDRRSSTPLFDVRRREEMLGRETAFVIAAAFAVTASGMVAHFFLAVDGWTNVIGDYAIMAVVLTRIFRFGTPLLAILAAFGITPWWLILIPVLPIWYSFFASLHEARERARIIRRPPGSMTSEEVAIERRFLYADAALAEAKIARADALARLAATRASRRTTPRWRRRARTLVERARRGGGSPSTE